MSPPDSPFIIHHPDMPLRTDIVRGKDLPRASKATNVDSRYNQQSAEHWMVSTDQVLFCVPSSILRQSEVLWDMTQDFGAGKQEIVLCDPTFEYSGSLRALLDVVSGVKFGDLAHATIQEQEAVCHSLLLAHKYDFKHAYNLTLAYLHIYLRDKVYRIPVTIFRIAALLDEEELAKVAVASMHKHTWTGVGNADPPPVSDLEGAHIPGLEVSNVSGWPFSAVEGIPATYMWALMRAVLPWTHGGAEGRVYSTNVPMRFVHFLQMAKVSQPSMESRRSSRASLGKHKLCDF